MKVLGIDLSLTCTGLAIADQGRVLGTATIKSTGTRGDTLAQREHRIFEIVSAVKGAIAREQPYMAVIEAPSFGSRHGSAHDRSGLWWAVVHALFDRNVFIAQVTPKQRAKYGTGNGNSEKKEVHAAVKKNYAREDLPIKTNDEADAVLLAAMGARHMHEAVDIFTVGPDQLAAMEKVVWPL